ncbi:MAG: ECF-type sigma factor [Steroidobacteraceae bacterium]
MPEAEDESASTEKLRDLLRASGPGGEPVPELFASLYAELHRISERQLRRCQADLTVSPTTLLHEAYLSVAGRDGSLFPDRHRFLAYAARAMRGLVIDHLRRRRAQKHGGQFFFTVLDTQILEATPSSVEDLSRLSDSLDELAQAEPRLAELVDLRFFCGMSLAEIASLRGASLRTIDRDWMKAKLYLRFQLDDAHRPG